MGGYFSPTKPFLKFKRYLDELELAIRLHSARPVNDDRRTALEDTIADCGITVVNVGSQHTCVRQNGGSIVDVSFASAPLAAYGVSKGRVRDDTETLSDHRYITMKVEVLSVRPRAKRKPRSRRWVLRELDTKLLFGAAQVVTWPEPPAGLRGLQEELWWFRETLECICDTAMPRSRGPPNWRSVYCWTEEIAQLRRACVAANHQCTHARRRLPGDDESIRAAERARKGYRAARKALRAAISKAKSQACTEFIEALDYDLWGHPYRTTANNVIRDTTQILQIKIQHVEGIQEQLDTALGEIHMFNNTPPPSPDHNR
ncbi:uncharacterized protein LOC109860886 [Pseudomyrmex gracilis]|uniref:uncharacterized protein LOC109860886 n=1 Tax=Pseudomyrmex gracilis TaxID=219809 RepID=UPI0009953583|nr:uncharacterized protein LOC109860886 [Pseudomyrmex gracilis]